MSRPSKSVSQEEFQALYAQLARLLADPERAADSLNGSPEKASVAFSKIGDSPELMTAWVVRWLTSAAKRRMWGTLRQLAYKKRQQTRTVDLSEEAYTALSETAKSHQMTLSAVILFLTKEKNDQPPCHFESSPGTEV